MPDPSASKAQSSHSSPLEESSFELRQQEFSEEMRSVVSEFAETRRELHERISLYSSQQIALTPSQQEELSDAVNELAYLEKYGVELIHVREALSAYMAEPSPLGKRGGALEALREADPELVEGELWSVLQEFRDGRREFLRENKLGPGLALQFLGELSSERTTAFVAELLDAAVHDPRGLSEIQRGILFPHGMYFAGGLRGVQWTDRILRILDITETEDEAQCVLKALARQRNKESLELLFNALDDPRRREVAMAVISLEDVDTSMRAVARLLQFKETEAVELAVSNIAHNKRSVISGFSVTYDRASLPEQELVVDALYKVAKESDGRAAREMAIKALVAFREPVATRALLKLSWAKDKEVSSIAQTALIHGAEGHPIRRLVNGVAVAGWEVVKGTLGFVWNSLRPKQQRPE